tara:strand:- start:4089 stop:5084 length:996 start_codon:yes stop_codon:yes gene_type:complete
MNKRVLGLAVSISILVFVLLNTNFKRVLESFSVISLEAILVAFIINVIGAVVLNTSQIYQHYFPFIKEKNHVSTYFRLLQVDFIIRYYSLVMPTAVTAVVKWHLFNKIGINKTFSGLALIVNKLLNLFFIFLFSSLAFFFLIKSDSSHQLLFVLSTCLAILLFLVILFFLSEVGVKSAKKFFYYVMKLPIRFLKEPSKKVFRSVAEFNRDFKSSKKCPLLNTLLIFVWPLLSFFVVAYSQMLVVNAIGYNVSIVEALFLRAAVLLAMMIPVSFAGIGFREVGVISVLGLYAISSEDALAVSLVLFGFQIIISFIGFLLLFFNSFRFEPKKC